MTRKKTITLLTLLLLWIMGFYRFTWLIHFGPIFFIGIIIAWVTVVLFVLTKDF